MAKSKLEIRALETASLHASRLLAGLADEEGHLADSLLAFARAHAEAALREVIAVKHGDWWRDEGKTWRVVHRVPNEGPSSQPFRNVEDVEHARREIIQRILAAAEDAEGGER